MENKWWHIYMLDVDNRGVKPPKIRYTRIFYTGITARGIGKRLGDYLFNRGYGYLNNKWRNARKIPVYVEYLYGSEDDARKREDKIKRMSRETKEKLIKSDRNMLVGYKSLKCVILKKNNSDEEIIQKIVLWRRKKMVEEQKHYVLVSKTKPETPRKAVKLKYPDGTDKWHTLNERVKPYCDSFETGAEYVIRFDEAEDKYGSPLIAFMQKYDKSKEAAHKADMDQAVAEGDEKYNMTYPGVKTEQKELVEEEPVKVEEVPMAPKNYNDGAFFGMCSNQALKILIAEDQDRTKTDPNDSFKFGEPEEARFKALVQRLFVVNSELRNELM